MIAFSIRVLAPHRHSTPDMRLPDVCLVRLRVAIQIRLRRQDDAAEAEATLHGLLVDERLLNRMGLLEAAESLERRRFCPARNGGDRRDARANGLPFDEDRAAAALPESAPELRTVQLQIVAEHVQQRRRRVRYRRCATLRSPSE